ncbi:MAG: TetR/AcrR family transcriptional regulator [Phycicoccus sp.]
MSRTLSPDVRRSLDDAADEIVYRDGVHAGSVDAICQAAGVGKPAFYRHYGSREAMLVDYLKRRRIRRSAAILDAVEASGRSPRRRVLAVVDWIADWIGSDDFVGCGFHRALVQRPPDLDELHGITRLQKAWLLDLLVRELTPLTSQRAVARHLFLLIEGAMAAAAYESRESAGISAGRDLRRLARAVLRGLG